jgi:thioesterase domain-containing protein
MAAHYLHEIRSVQPQGPYYIGGLSLGGVIAFEMARQLEREGETTALVALLDTHLHHRYLPAHARVHYHLMKLRQHVTGTLGGSFDDVRDSLRRMRRRWRVRRTRTAGTTNAPATLVEVQDLIEVAFHKYRPQPYGGRLTLLRAREPHPHLPSDPAIEWPRWTLAGLDIHNVPGDHMTMFQLANIDALAARLAACIAEAQRRHAAP